MGIAISQSNPPYLAIPIAIVEIRSAIRMNSAPMIAIVGMDRVIKGNQMLPAIKIAIVETPSVK